MRRFEGLIAAAHTPFSNDGNLNLAVIDEQARLLVESGVSAVFVCGTTGESHSLTVAERKQLAERWTEIGGEYLPVIIHVGHNCQADAADLAAHAQRRGAAAIAAMAPSYFRPESADDLIGFLEPIAAAAPELPFYYYDIPELTGVRFPADQLLRHGRRRIPTLTGIKYTSDDFMALQASLQLQNGTFDILFGCDELLLSGLAFGVRGAVGSTYNYAAPVYQRVIQAFDAGDLPTARIEQRKSVLLVKVLNEFGVLRAGKAIMSLIDVDCGPVRPPIRPMNADEIRALHERIRDFDIFPRPLRVPE